jgi:hypothetical protein
MKPQRHEVLTDKDTFIIYVTPPSILGLPTVSVELTKDQYRRYRRWIEGIDLIQNALPDLSASEREKLMTGLGDEDFHRFAGGEDDGE